MVNPVIDALVTPENLARMLQGDKPEIQKMGGAAQPARKLDSEIDATMAYEGFDRFVVVVRDKPDGKEPVGFVFKRDGLFTWKLSALQIPI